jgi:hypothetical protein
MDLDYPSDRLDQMQVDQPVQTSELNKPTNQFGFQRVSAFGNQSAPLPSAFGLPRPSAFGLPRPSAFGLPIRAPVPFVPPTPRGSNLHVFIDGLNMAGAMQTVINSDPDALDFMDINRSVASHQLNDNVELNRFLTILDQNLRQLLPERTTVHLVFKRFGCNQMWSAFKQMHRNLLQTGEQFLNHILIETSGNGEVDDLTVAKEAVQYRQNGHRVYILSRDKYRSRPDNWNLISHIVSTSSNGQTTGTIGAGDVPLSYRVLRNIEQMRVEFNFSVQNSCLQMNLLKSIHAV